MTDTWDERKRALEEDYFHRKEKEAIERMRAKRAAEGAAAVAGLQCPKCDGTLMEIDYDVVKIDRCEKCNGIWLDAGELEQLTKHEDGGGFMSRLFGSFSRK
jgi:Zn-finger nucleic acid-binding protein